jgi:hypothetical protein
MFVLWRNINILPAFQEFLVCERSVSCFSLKHVNPVRQTFVHSIALECL